MKVRERKIELKEENDGRERVMGRKRKGAVAQKRKERPGKLRYRKIVWNEEIP